MFDPDEWPDDDCVAGGADLEPGTLLEAYRRGAFPMPHDRELLWWSPMRRGVLVPDDIRVSRSLARSVRRFTMTLDESFEEVIDACADPSRPGAWIDSDIRAAYVRMHELGWAHSVETRAADGTLVGGLYGLSIGALFAGESMFHRATDASKAALVELARLVGAGGLIDTQWSTPHLASLGVTEWPRELYLERINDLVDAPPPAVWA
ncbi:leucyl/phenylalanyl-tRNA--protein transferase [Aeromicrobium fastidiosum]|uniref:Leucyl/phenylalanyl-tRNA--protein transferase n=2 Tax=Aeromicrobium fastidiosum TaxID=52699 RepID=A0A641AS73_9ACTN|nr:leucyl/phenylalanyl-tRNA--protein transferase [Aeromicrobium fastidiosum]